MDKNENVTTTKQIGRENCILSSYNTHYTET